MGYILRIGYRHLEAIRSQTLVVCMAFNWSKRVFDFRRWLSVQAPELVGAFDAVGDLGDIPSQFENDRHWHYSMLLNIVLRQYEDQSDEPIIRAVSQHSNVSSSMSEHSQEDYAGAAQGGSWDSEPFAFRAGMVMTLGALEEFERGTLRILTKLKHDGKSFVNESQPFRPRLVDYRSINPLWKQLEGKRRTYTSRDRMSLLQGFGIEKPQTEWRKRLDMAWKKRNDIAHGLSPVDAKLSTYLQTYYDAFSAMNWLSESCFSAQNVSL